jgi:hypothetical protein
LGNDGGLEDIKIHVMKAQIIETRKIIHSDDANDLTSDDFEWFDKPIESEMKNHVMNNKEFIKLLKNEQIILIHKNQLTLFEDEEM